MNKLGAIGFALFACSSPSAEPVIDAAPADLDAATASVDAAAGPATRDQLRDRLFRDHVAPGEACAAWTALDVSQRAVFLTLTDRLFQSEAPDQRSMLEHMTDLHLILGGGAGGSCGGSANNRLFLSMDEALATWMELAFDEAAGVDDEVSDGGGQVWAKSNDSAGPHEPFTASNETGSGLKCVLLLELPDSRPPTGQAHFFRAGTAVAIDRGANIQLPADPRMLEIDHDYNCVHDSNPTCGDFEERYRNNYGDFGCEWVPTACVAAASGCWPDASAP